MASIQPIEWPVVEIAGRSLTFRVSYSSHVQLALWKTDIMQAGLFEVGAASAGTFGKNGKWRSEGYERAIDFVDLLEPKDFEPIRAAVNDALKKAYPELELCFRPVPGTEEKESPKPNSFASGPSEPAEAGSDLTGNISGA